MLEFVYFVDDSKISKLLNKLSNYSTIFHWETSQLPAPTPQRPYNVSCEQNRYVTLPPTDGHDNSLIVLDDLMAQCTND